MASGSAIFRPMAYMSALGYFPIWVMAARRTVELKVPQRDVLEAIATIATFPSGLTGVSIFPFLIERIIWERAWL